MTAVIYPDREAREATEAEKARTERAVAIHEETDAMHRAFLALQRLDFNARKRVLRWLADSLDNVEVPF